jgi:DNA-binding NarL/FixJ family response regulator
MAAAPLVVVEDHAGYDAVRDELIGAGWELQPPDRAGSAGTVVTLSVATPPDAQAALLLAIGGAGLLVRADAERSVVDDLVEDLGRIGRVLLVDGPRAIRLDPDTWRLVHALAEGTTVSAVARTLHMSVRTANRRLTDAKDAMNAPTRAQLLRTLTAADRIPAARLTR